MFVPFSSLPPSARVWIFQSNRPFGPDEMAFAEGNLRQFTDGWTVHGAPLNASFTIEHHQFIVLAADESHASASGCSIDSSVRALKEIEQSVGIDLFDRSHAAFMIGNKVQLIPVSKLKEKFGDGTLNSDSLTFNNLVNTKSALSESWLAPAASTWLKRYLPAELLKVK